MSKYIFIEINKSVLLIVFIYKKLFTLSSTNVFEFQRIRIQICKIVQLTQAPKNDCKSLSTVEWKQERYPNILIINQWD